MEFSNNKKEVSVSFLQQNMHKSKEITIEINKWLEGLNGGEGVALLQEPNNKKGKITGIGKDFDIFTSNTKSNVRAAIITTKGLKCWKLDQFCNEDQSTIALYTGANKIMAITSVYMPYDSPDPPPSNTLIYLTNFCENNGWELIVGADANSHNVSWGSSDTNNRGEKLLDFIVTTNLHICNIGTTPTFENAIRSEVIDITLATNNTVDKINKWAVNRNVSLSDHNRITYELNTNIQQSEKAFRNVRKTDWEKFRQILGTELGKLKNNFDEYDLDTKANKINETLIKAYESSNQLRTKKTSSKPKWWSSELERLKRDTQRFLNKYRKNPTESRREQWKETSTLYKKEIKKAQSNSWKAFCGELKDTSAIAKLQKLMKEDNRSKLGTVRKQNGEYTTTPEETLEELLRVLFPDMNAEEEVDTVEEPNEGQDNDTDEDIDLEGMINTESVETAISSFKPYKSPGPDGIYPALLQQGIKELTPFLVTLYRESIRERRPAKEWLENKAVFIPKPGKADYTDPKSYRPISLSSFILKGLERLIHWQLLDTNLKRKPFPKNLYSYREGISTETALHRTISKIESTLSNNQIAIVVFLDISGAFSEASIQGMLNALEKRNINKQLKDWIEHMLKNRKVTVYMGDSSANKELNRGTPQGGILSPTIFNIDTEDGLSRIPEKGPTEGHGYADDIKLIGTGIDENAIATNIQKDLRSLEGWAGENALAFNPNKTKVMIFTRKRQVKKPKIYLQGVELEYVEEFKYLGITIDNKLNWRKHIENQTKRAQMALNTGRRMIGNKWGLKPKQMTWLYESIVRPILTYGSIVWASSLDRSYIIKLLEKVQRTACMMITGAMKSTPTAGLECILNITPIQIHIKKEALASYVRLQHTSSWRPRKGEPLWEKGHTSTISKLVKEIPELMQNKDKLKSTHRSTRQFETKIEKREDIVKVRPRPFEERTINCYTDGSRTDGITGAGYIYMSQDFKEQESIFLGKEATVFQAEIIAITEAGRSLIRKGLSEYDIRIYIDSQSAIRAVSHYNTKSICVLECKETLNKLGKDNKVTLNWIPGHEGHMGNEVADRLAKRGVYTHKEGPEPFVPIGNKTSKGYIKNWENKQKDLIWKNRTDCRQTKIWLTTINRAWSKEILKLNRKDIRYITQILTGHSNLRRHRYIMGLEEDPNCEKCKEEEETPEHLLTKCPCLAKLRYEVLGSAFPNRKHIVELKLRTILKFIKLSKRLEN